MALRTPLTAQPHLYIGDSTGRPLDYGRVYFGEPNKDPEFYPIDIYLDPEMTISAAQPVRTKGGFMDVGGNLAELHAAEVVYSLKVLDQYGRQVFYKPEMYRNNVSDFLQDEITRATAAETLIAGNLTAETQRAIAAEKVIANAVVTEKDRAIAAEGLLDDKYEGLSTTIGSIGGGKKAYTTYALMVADKNNIAANSSIDVTNDTDTSKNGTYAYDGTTFTKSPYDPLTLSKTYADGAAQSAVTTANAYTDVVKQDIDDITKPISGRTAIIKTESLGNYTHAFLDAQGTIVFGIREDGQMDTSVNLGIGGLGISEMRSGILSADDMNAVGLKLDADYFDKPPLQFFTDVSPVGADGTVMQRMPNVVKLSDTRIFVIFSQFSTAGADAYNGRLVGRFVDFDLVNKTSIVSATVPIDGRLTGDLMRHPVVVKLRDKILLMFNSGTEIVQIESYDNCETWINRKVSDTGGSVLSYITLNACEQITEGLYAGRLYLAAQSGGSDGRRMGILYSDDSGNTWRESCNVLVSDVFPDVIDTNEISMTIDSTQTELLLAIRTTEINRRKVLFAKVVDDGTRFIPVGFEPDIPTSWSVFGFKQMAKYNHEGVPKVIMSHPANPKTSPRNAFRVRLSYDNCQSFISEYAPLDDSVFAGYSSITRISNDEFVVVYEEGFHGDDSKIVALFLNLAEIK